jgi:hypothetical protein
MTRKNQKCEYASYRQVACRDACGGSELTITAILEAKGGTASLTQNGDVLFKPDATYTGVMAFRYTVQNAQGNYAQVTSSSGQTAAMKARVLANIGHTH